ncbi:hypothetical protein EY04_24130 [Pseudomonas chlororaphis]|uniref:hypothetical protein n=1 Tax=Pseudomonas chlororaphis TaxID=587753 RepID=UPI0004AC0DEC|nr:hypothetical protein [Pseudomonas chlororaphis]AIC21885.1 hypothetical protein EY04_24130 [Pseudomonas chlororaphis]
MIDLMDEREVAQRFCSICAIIIAIVGVGISLYCLSSPPGFFSGLPAMLAIIALVITNLLCFPLVLAYWLLAYRPSGVQTLLFLQILGFVLFGLWYVLSLG